MATKTVTYDDHDWQLVPKAATPRMKAIGHRAFECSAGVPRGLPCHDIGFGAFGEVYAAMLLASPQHEP